MNFRAQLYHIYCDIALKTGAILAFDKYFSHSICLADITAVLLPAFAAIAQYVDHEMDE